MSAPTSTSSARNLFIESKARLSDRIQVNVNNTGSIAKQIVRGSKSNETLMHTARNFALQEYALENSETNLKRMQLLTNHLNLQLDNIQKSALLIEDVKEQLHQILS
ncbi:BLOC-1-related complex subunit 7-like [Argiope bruennichi]|uniref:BLOC-1-related complex subunit 7 n=1 Tax=Argiope bruennichi TaxID=94029 RepID=A0A8T0E9N7_ARGBR|nr:BLOC-1-related complex subunit 7-like [Argiope bruennichi]KAF8768030.1 BLOC-1-related complex subunit 7 like protein [Argiope bruennichi]